MDIQELGSKLGSMILLLAWPLIVIGIIGLILTIFALGFWSIVYMIAEISTFVELTLSK